MSSEPRPNMAAVLTHAERLDATSSVDIYGYLGAAQSIPSFRFKMAAQCKDLFLDENMDLFEDPQRTVRFSGPLYPNGTNTSTYYLDEDLTVVVRLLEAGNTVATDLDKHQLWRLANILTTRECKDLLSVLSRPEPDIFLQMKRVSPQELPHPWESDYKMPCNVVLMRWLVKNGKQIYFDRLYRALQQIGRTDIAKEMGKNINQDKILNLQRYVDGYHEYVKGIKSTLLEIDQHPQAEHGVIREGRDLTQSILRPAVEHKQPPPYDRHPLDGVLPLLKGFLISVAGSVLVGLAVLLFILQSSRNNLQKLQ